MSLNYVTVTGTFQDGTGNPLPLTGQTAYALFTPSTQVFAQGIPLITPAQPIQAPISGGSLLGESGGALKLLATDNTGLTYGGLTGFFYWTVTIVINGVAQPAWSFFLPHSPSTVDLSQLANTSAGGSSGFANPMTTTGDMIDGGAAGAAQRLAIGSSGQVLTVVSGAPAWQTPSPALPLTTLGDTVYENATPAPARLPGNTSATKNFLTQTGTGSVSAAPAWGTIAAGDVPGFDGVTVTGTPSSGQVPVATSGTAATWQAPGVAYQPWQFQPESYGAKGDGKVIGDAVLASNTTLTSASAGFTAADTGKYIMVNGGAGTANIPLITTITFVNSTTVTLGTAASVSGSGFQAVYGTDDTAAINSAVSAAGTYATANKYYAEIVFGAKIYVLATGPTQAGNGTTTPTFNAQIPLPYPNANGTSQKLVIALTGANDNAAIQYWLSTTPNVAGTALVSMTTAPLTPSATFGRQSVIGGPSGGAGFSGSFANVKAIVKGISVWCPIFTNQVAFGLGYVGGARIDSCSAQVFAPPNAGQHPYLSDLPPSSVFQNNTIGVGLQAPLTGNNDDVTIPSFAVEGYETGIWAADHFTAGRIAELYVDLGLLIDQTHGISGSNHAVTIANWSIEQYNGGLRSNGGGGTYCMVDIVMDAETPSGIDPSYDISDAGNVLYGRVAWSDPGRTHLYPIVSGAANLKVVNGRLGPGHWASPPAVPASTTAQQNTAWRDASIVVHTGAGVTVSAVNVDGTVTGLTMAASSSLALPVLPAGKNVTLTYAGGTPTWDWWLD
jgi:hypothetical protein